MTNRHFATIAVQLLLIAGIPIAYFQFPVIYARLVTEDSWGEFATFAALIMAALLFATCYKSSGCKRQRFWYVLLAVCCFLVGMEEISWGQRVIGLKTPEALGAINL